MVIFNRSHYEDVLMVRVHQLIEKVWTALRGNPRFRAAALKTGTTILKFFLYISKQEQLSQFAERLDDPARNWKISKSDYSASRKLGTTTSPHSKTPLVRPAPERLLGT